MKKSNLIFIIIAFMAISCSKKTIPSITVPTVANPCDTALHKLMDSIAKISVVKISTVDKNSDTITLYDSSGCDYYKKEALVIASKYNDIIKERDFYKDLSETLKATRARKIVNNINSNNNSSINTGKNSQVGDANVSQRNNKAPAINGDSNTTFNTKKKSPIINGDGNTQDNSSHDRFWLGVLVTLGALYTLKIAFGLLKTYVPISAPFIMFIKKFLP